MDYGIEAAPQLEVLPTPRQWGGRPLLEALRLRRSAREFSGGRTAPSAHDWEEIDIFVASAGGVYLYDADDHVLHKRLDTDIRASTGMQPFVAEAPVNLVYVADLSRMSQATAEEKARYPARTPASSRRTCLSSAPPKLAPPQQIILAQSVGYPAEH